MCGRIALRIFNKGHCYEVFFFGNKFPGMCE